MPRKLNIDKSAVVDYWKNCNNMVQTSKHFSVSHSWVQLVIAEHGLGPGAGNANYDHKRNLPMDEVIERYQNGATCAELEQIYGLDKEQIRRRLKRRGVQMRKGGCRTPQHNSQYQGKGKYRENKYQARKIAEQILGRKLKRGEVVHHHNENPLDNNPENLWLFQNNSDHSRYHCQLRGYLRQGIEVDKNQLALENGGVPLRQQIYQIAS